MKSDFDYGTGGAVMSRKDYIRFAQVLASYKCDYHDEGTHPRVVADFLALRIADIFAEDNPNFDRSRFLEACTLAGDEMVA